MTKTYVVDGIEYAASNRRMRYSPKFHGKHYRPYTVEELAYMCSMRESMKVKDIAMALERTPGSITSQIYLLKKNNDFEKYKEMGEWI